MKLPADFSQPLVKVYEACVDTLLVNLARHFNRIAGGNTGTFDYEVELLAKMGAIHRESAAIIARHFGGGKLDGMIRLAVETAMLNALKTVEPTLRAAAERGLLQGASVSVDESVLRQLTAYSRQAVQKMNLVNTVMLDGCMQAWRKGVYTLSNAVRQLDAAQLVLNTETGKVITGTSTLQEAVRSAVQRMHAEGLTGFVDRGGHRWSPEAYARMDIKTTCSNAARQAVLDRNRDYGNDLVWVRINATARPKCYPWQGKVISMDGQAGTTTDLNGRSVRVYAVQETSYGEPDGLWGINCHHGPPNVFIPGVSVVRGAESMPDKEVNEKAYAETQQQRRLERDVRYAKREAAMLDAAGDKEGFEQAALKVKRKQEALNAFTKSTGRAKHGDRTQVLGYNKSVAGKANAALALREKRVAWDRDFDDKHRAKTLDELLPSYKRAENIREKLSAYTLNQEHSRGKHKAIVFESALGYNKDTAQELAAQIQNGLKKYRAVPTGNNGFGESYRVTMLINGAGSKSDVRQPVETGWIIRNGEKFPRMVNAIVSKGKRP